MIDFEKKIALKTLKLLKKKTLNNLKVDEVLKEYIKKKN